MKTFPYRISVNNVKLIVFVLLFSSNILAQEIKDIIRPLRLASNKTDTILVSDLFYATDYSITFDSSDNFYLRYIKPTKQLLIKPNERAEGIQLISFNLSGKKYFIPVETSKINYQKFTYKAKGKASKAFLFGSFNGWNRKNLPMKETSRGIFEIEIPLEPGMYEYKFFVDGKELLDGNNPVTVPNGFGGFNCVINIKPKYTGTAYLHLIKKDSVDEEYNFTFYFESSNSKYKLKKEDVVALINNKKIPLKAVTVNNNFITLSFSREELKGSKVLRIAVNSLGHASNIQTLRLFNGIAAGNLTAATKYDAIIYAIMIDRFFDGDKSNSIPVKFDSLERKANYNGGDLTGIKIKLDEGYFDSLGINTLWLSPVVDNTDSAYREFPPPHRYYSGYHGYWPISSTKVEERFGDMNILKDLISSAHQHKIKVLLDFVANHIHIEHPWWKEHRNWFGNLRLPDGRLNLRLWDEQRLTTWFEPFMPSFDYSNDSAVDAMTDNAVWWIKQTGADGFRHDAVKHVPNVFWRSLTRKLKEQIEIPFNKTLLQIGETFGSYSLVGSYVNNGQLDAQFNFLLYDTALPVFLEKKNSFKMLDDQIHKTFSVYGVNNLMGNIMDSHDKVRYMAYADSDLTLSSNNAAELGWINPPQVDYKSSYDKLKLYLAYELTIPGIPIINYGDEIGMTGAADPDNRRMMRFEPNISSIEKSTLTDVSLLINIRNSNSALRYGDFLTLKADSNIYVYMRSDLNGRVLVALNKSDVNRITSVDLPAVYEIKKATDLINKNELRITKNKLHFNLNGIGYRIFRLD